MKYFYKIPTGNAKDGPAGNPGGRKHIRLPEHLNAEGRECQEQWTNRVVKIQGAEQVPGSRTGFAKRNRGSHNPEQCLCRSIRNRKWLAKKRYRHCSLAKRHVPPAPDSEGKARCHEFIMTEKTIDHFPMVKDASYNNERAQRDNLQPEESSRHGNFRCCPEGTPVFRPAGRTAGIPGGAHQDPCADRSRSS